MTRPNDPFFDQRIADWLEADPLRAPDRVLEVVLAALPSIPRRRTFRAPRRFIAMPMSFRLAIAAAVAIAVLGVGGAVAVGPPALRAGLAAVAVRHHGRRPPHARPQPRRGPPEDAVGPTGRGLALVLPGRAVLRPRARRL